MQCNLYDAYASFVGNFDMHHINYIAFNKNFMMNMSVLDSIFRSMDHIFSINFSDYDKRYDSYFDLMKEMALIADSSKYLFDELYDLVDDEKLDKIFKELQVDSFDELLKLPGVGRKSANLIMGDVFGKPAIVTDTHCIRLCNRIGLVDNIKDPKKVEMALWKIIPPEEGSDFCHRLVDHGREVCTARTTPHCDKCCLNDICKKRI